MSFLKEYTLLGELGKGGFAKVYKVRHNELGYIRAIRVLNESITDERSKTYQKFLHECKVLLRLGNGSHRNIVHIYQPRLLDNHALVEMDYVDGQDITHYLKENGNWLPIEEVLRLVEEMSNALAYCHEDIYQFCMDPDEDDLQNDPVDGSKWLIDDATKKRLVEKYKVIHNDIHSGNIMRRRDGSFVLLDFGLAIEGDEVVKSSSRHENGSPEYMPPEKWDNDTILTEQSDVYSFGVVMYEYLAGRVPFVCEGNSFNARTKLYEQIKNSTSLPSIMDLRKSFFEEKYKGKTYEKDYPDWLETAILKCLEKDPANRFRNGKELYDYVAKHLQDDAITKEMVQGLEDEIASLKDERKQVLDEIAVLTRKNDDLAGLADEVASLKDERKQALAQIAALAKKNEDMAGLADKTGRDLEQARIALVNLKEQKEQQDERLHGELGVLQDEVKQKDETISSLQRDIMKLEGQVASTTGNSELQKRIDALQRQCDGLGKEVDQTQREKRNLEEKMENLKKSGGKKSPLPVILCVLLGVAAAVLGALYFLNQGKADGVPSDYESIMTENANLKQSNDDLAEQVSNLESSNEELENQVASLRNELDNMPIDDSDAQAKIAELNDQISALNEEIDGLKKTNNDLTNQLNTANSTISALRAELKNNKPVVKPVVKESEPRVKELEDELAAVRESLAGANKKIDEQKKTIADKNKTIADKDKEIGLLRKAINGE